VVRRYRQRLPRTSDPQMAAVQPKVADGTLGQRYQIVFYPTPAAAATVTFQMQLLPETVTSDAPYPLGGARYAEAILECCLAAAETTMDDAQGVHATKAAEQVMLAIKSDNEHKSIHNLGYNSDPTVHPHDQLPFRRSTGVTYNGVSY